MSIINVCGLTLLVGLVMQNYLFSSFFVVVVYKKVIYFVSVLPTVSSHHHQRDLLSDIFLPNCFDVSIMIIIFFKAKTVLWMNSYSELLLLLTGHVIISDFMFILSLNHITPVILKFFVERENIMVHHL